MQKTLIQIAQQIAGEFTLPTPQAVVSSQDVNTLQILAFVRATCDDLLQERDWQFLIKRNPFTTVGGQQTYPFPTDIKRFISTSFYDVNNRWQMSGPLTATEWEQLVVSNLATSPFQRYRVFGGTIQLWPVPTSNAFTFVYEYVSNSYVLASGTTNQVQDFTQDSDVCMFDHRLVIYGAKLKFLASKGLDTTAALVDYTRALNAEKAGDTPDRVLSITRGGMGVALLSGLNVPDTGFGQ
jgi:hypothetical protein